MRYTRSAFASLFLLLAACLTDGDPLLFINFDTQLPPTTTADEITVAGSVVRSPAKLSTIKFVTATGAAETVVDTTDSFGIFRMTIRLNPGVTNLVVFVAEDDSGAISSRIQWEVQQQAAS